MLFSIYIYMCREPPKAVIELQNYGLPFSPTEKITKYISVLLVARVSILACSHKLETLLISCGRLLA